MLEILGNVLTLGTVIGLILTLIARFIPNEKLYAWGLMSGRFFNVLGTTKIGAPAWERLEDFLVNSVGEYLRGMKDGLDESDKD
jgi:hypothetical protein